MEFNFHSRWTTGRLIPGVGSDFFLVATASRPALGTTQLPIQLVPEVFSL